jgi:hypothetical protein
MSQIDRPYKRIRIGPNAMVVQVQLCFDVNLPPLNKDHPEKERVIGPNILVVPLVCLFVARGDWTRCQTWWNHSTLAHVSIEIE